MICTTDARLALEWPAARNDSNQPAVPQPVSLVWQIVHAHNRHSPIGFATSLCSSAFPSRSLVTGSASVNPITYYFLRADTSLNKWTDGGISLYRPTDWLVSTVQTGVWPITYIGGYSKNHIEANDNSKPRDWNFRAHLGCPGALRLDELLPPGARRAKFRCLNYLRHCNPVAPTVRGWSWCWLSSLQQLTFLLADVEKWSGSSTTNYRMATSCSPVSLQVFGKRSSMDSPALSTRPDLFHFTAGNKRLSPQKPVAEH